MMTLEWRRRRSVSIERRVFTVRWRERERVEGWMDGIVEREKSVEKIGSPDCDRLMRDTQRVPAYGSNRQENLCVCVCLSSLWRAWCSLIRLYTCALTVRLGWKCRGKVVVVVVAAAPLHLIQLVGAFNRQHTYTRVKLTPTNAPQIPS